MRKNTKFFFNKFFNLILSYRNWQPFLLPNMEKRNQRINNKELNNP